MAEPMSDERRRVIEIRLVSARQHPTPIPYVVGNYARDVADLLAEVDRLREWVDYARLLGPARMVLDRCAERPMESAEEAADMAQRIVDLIGHDVTDEPPHAIVERDRLRAEVDRLRKVISDAARYSTPHTPVSSASTVAYVPPVRGW